MSGSSNTNTDIILTIYKDLRTVFRLNDIAMMVGETDFQSLNKKLNYYVHTDKILNPRKGIYVKPKFSVEELACNVYTPSYISLEYVLQKNGIIFQFDSRITVISYLSRTIEIANQTYLFRKLKGEILVNTKGILRQNNINIATPERAVLDTLHLNKDYYFDNLNPINKDLLYQILPLYQSKALTRKVDKLFKND